MTVTHGRGLDRLLFWTIAVTSAGFVFILALSAFFDHSIIVLHFFQALQYLVIVALAARANRWGYFIGISVSAFWDYGGMFVNSFVESGWRALMTSIHSGVLAKPDQIIAVFAFGFHLLLVVAAAVAYFRLERRYASDWGRLAASFAGAIGYFIAIVALFQPRYLVMVPRLLHPHIPF
jgi:hypothetical protein